MMAAEGLGLLAGNDELVERDERLDLDAILTMATRAAETAALAAAAAGPAPAGGALHCPMCTGPAAEKDWEATRLSSHVNTQQHGPSRLQLLGGPPCPARDALLTLALRLKRKFCKGPLCGQLWPLPRAICGGCRRDEGWFDPALVGSTWDHAPPGAPPPPEGQPALDTPAAEQGLLTMLQQLGESWIPTLEDLPKASRGPAAELQARAFADAHKLGSVRAWVEMLALPKTLFGYVPAHVRKRMGKGVTMAKILRDRLEAWRDGSGAARAEMIQNAVRVATVQQRERTPRTGLDLAEANRRRARALAENGRLADATAALVASGVAPAGPETMAQLEAKHPQAEEPVQPDDPQDVEPMDVPLALLERCVRSFKRATACGLQGMQPAHLAYLFKGSLRDRLGPSLQLVVTDMLRGKVPLGLAPLLAGGSLTALQKKAPEGSAHPAGIRPIAVGEILRRLAAKVAVQKVRARAREIFEPWQLGVGTPNGGEAILHATQAVLQEHRRAEQDPSGPGAGGLTMLKIDFRNAFNEVSRTEILARVKAELPELLPWVRFCYQQRSRLHVRGAGTIWSSSGVQQGDPLGPLLFALVLQPLVLKIRERCPGLVLNVWYLDDGTLVGSPDQVRAAYDILVEEGRDVGLHLNPAKCELWWWGEELEAWRDFDASIQRVTSDGIGLLGGMLGAKVSMGRAFRKRLDDMGEVLGALRELEDPQVQLLLLRACIGFPTINFALRTTDPEAIVEDCARFDDMIVDALTPILGGYKLGPQQRLQAALPIGMAGLGLPSARDLAHACFLGSVAQSLPIQRLLAPPDVVLPRSECSDALDAFNLAHPAGEEGEPLTLQAIEQTARPQEHLTLKVHEHRKAELVEATTGHGREQTRARALLGKGTGHWLRAPPLAFCGLSMAPEDFRVCLKLRLGIELFRGQALCPRCKCIMDDHGDHALLCGSGDATSCRGVGYLVGRHNAVARCLTALYRAAGMEVTPEVATGWGDLKRGGDLFVRGLAGVEGMAIDVAVVSPHAGGGEREPTLENPAVAASRKEAEKEAKHGADCRRRGWAFKAFALDVYGNAAPGARELADNLACAYGARQGLSEGQSKVRVWQRVSVTLQRGIAASLLSRVSM
jgi:hypothetical protein